MFRSLVLAIFLCLLGYAPQAGATPPCPSRTEASLAQDLERGTLDCADLRGANLAGADLAQANLGRSDLRGANLTGANLTQANLWIADLRGADLTGADLTQANLSGADLRGATLDGVSAVQALGLAEIRVDPVGPGAYVQVSYLLLGPAAALLLVWWRRRFGRLSRLRRLRPADMVAAGVGVAVAVTGLYLLCCGAVRGFASAVAGWLWAADPGPVVADPLLQLGMGAGALVVAAFVLRARGRRGESPENTGQLALGRPTPGRPFPPVGPRLRGLAALAGVLGLLDLIGVVVLWVLGLLPAHGPLASDAALGHLVVVGVATVFLIRAAQPDPVAEAPATLSGVVLDERAGYVWLSGVSSRRHPANVAVPWDSLEHVHLIRTLGATGPGTGDGHGSPVG